MRIATLRMAYMAVLLGAGGFITVGPYGAWPMIDIADLGVLTEPNPKISRTAAVAPAVPAAVVASAEAQNCAGPGCEDGAVLPVATAITAAATVVAGSQAAPVANVDGDLQANSLAVAAPRVSATQHPAVAAVPSNAPLPGKAVKAATKVALAVTRPVPPHTVAPTKSRARPTTEKPHADADWARRLVFNRNG